MRLLNLLFCLSVFVLAGCNSEPENQTVPTETANLLDSIHRGEMDSLSDVVSDQQTEINTLQSELSKLKDSLQGDTPQKESPKVEEKTARGDPTDVPIKRLRKN